MQFQVFASPYHYSCVDVEVRLVDGNGRVIRDQEVTINLCVLDAESLIPVPYCVGGESYSGPSTLSVGQGGYVRNALVFDSQLSVREVIIRVSSQECLTQFYNSEPVKLLKYRIMLTDVRLTDDIANYIGEGGIHYTNNDSARIKVFYSIDSANGAVTDTSELSHIHSEMTSQFLFANGQKVQYVGEDGELVDFTHVDCAVKRKSKTEAKTRVTKKVFEERRAELNINSQCGVVKASYRLNMFSSHQKLKECNLQGRKYTIELSHPHATAVSIPPVHILTKYHRPKKNKAHEDKHTEDKPYQDKHNINKEKKIKVKEERIEASKENSGGLCHTNIIMGTIISHRPLMFIHDKIDIVGSIFSLLICFSSLYSADQT